MKLIKMKKALTRPYIYLTISVFLIYIFINLIASGFYETIPLIAAYAKTVNWLKLIISLILSLTIGVLVALNATYSYISFRERKKCLSGTTTAGVGTVGGLIAGVCPLCVTGLFPLIFGLFGISFSLASLPFQGIEVQLAVVVLLAISLKMFGK